MSASIDPAEGPGGLNSDYPSGDWDRDVQCLSDRLVAAALGRVRLRRLLAGFCDGMNAAGLPVLRAISALSALHPMYAAHTYTWVRGRDNVASDILHGAHNSDAWRPLGRFDVAGVARAQEVFAPPEAR
ncbi:MAG: hypothetical protein VW268_08350 [Rhodospirillaceae bacterium]